MEVISLALRSHILLGRVFLEELVKRVDNGMFCVILNLDCLKKKERSVWFREILRCNVVFIFVKYLRKLVFSF
jgi:hypothetical protein